MVQVLLGNVPEFLHSSRGIPVEFDTHTASDERGVSRHGFLFPFDASSQKSQVKKKSDFYVSAIVLLFVHIGSQHQQTKPSSIINMIRIIAS